VFNTGEKKLKSFKVVFLVAVTLISLCAVNVQPVNSQITGIIYITSEGVSSSSNATIPIQQDGNVYTFTDNINGYYLSIQTGNVVVDGAGYYLTGQGEIGIDLSGRSNVTIKNLQIGSNLYGVYLYGSSNITLSGNTISHNSYGLYIYGGSKNTISGNTITDNAIGINIFESTKNVLRNNTMDNDFNFAIDGTDGSHFDNDVDDSNTVSGKKIHYLISQSGLIVNSVTFPDAGYLALVNCQNISVHHLELSGNGQGILLAFTTDSTLYKNQLTDNYCGIELFASTSNVISTNTITNNEKGIQFSNASSMNSIATNVISDNSDGIFFYSSYQNTMILNNVTDNNLGIGFRESSYNMIRGNHFVDNKVQVYDVSMENHSLPMSQNTWDIGYPSGGNYWSDYTGVDARTGKSQNETGSDQLGDTPYVIDEINQDNYPLMPYGSPPAVFIDSPENKTYTVTSVSLKYTVTEETSWVKYSLDEQENVTANGDVTLSDLEYGEHSIKVYVEATDGKAGKSETLYFTIAEGAAPPQPDFSGILLVVAIVAAAAIIGAILFFFMKADNK
jgi:parallel beta-helix repeat protein